jgi:HSP20 family molecular chaperone IbpA
MHMRPKAGHGDGAGPGLGVSRSENEYLIRIEIPDVKKEDVKIAVADGIITISGEVLPATRASPQRSAAARGT